MKFHKELFSQNHSDIKAEWQNEKMTVSDDAETAKCREVFAQNGDLQSALRLVSALCFQLRYTESLDICLKFDGQNPHDYALQRRLGVLYFKLLQFDKCIEKMNFCVSTGNEPLETNYILAFAYYCNGDFAQAEEKLSLCLRLSEDMGEMYVAALFWHFCCLKKQNKPLDKFWETARHAWDCGHHTGYDAAVQFACGKITERTANNIVARDTDLNKICLYYGLAMFFDGKKRDFYLKKVLQKQDLFGAYVYIAAYCER